eukprot:SAG11_NODE_1422_length_4951_cov_4.752112_4_plen_72_part_00
MAPGAAGRGLARGGLTAGAWRQEMDGLFDMSERQQKAKGLTEKMTRCVGRDSGTGGSLKPPVRNQQQLWRF